MRKVHVIIPTFNPADSLSRAVKAALDQTYKDLVLTVVDDGSAEDIWPLIKKFKRDSRFRYIRLSENSGPSNARNMGLLLGAQAELITFHDDDDEPAPTKLEQQRQALSEPKLIDQLRKRTIARGAAEKYDVVANKVTRREVDGSSQVAGEMIYLLRDIYPNAYGHFGSRGRKYSLHFLSSLFDKSVFIKLGGLYNSLHWYEDNELAARLVLGGMNFNFLDQPLYEFNKNADSLTYKKDQADNRLLLQLFSHIQTMKTDSMTLNREEFSNEHCQLIKFAADIDYAYNLTAADIDTRLPSDENLILKLKSKLDNAAAN